MGCACTLKLLLSRALQWDAGLATPDHTPHGRGYNQSLVYLSAANDYWSSIVSGGPGNTASQGFCASDQLLTDLWKDDAPAFGLNNSWACATGNENGCTWEDDLFNTFVVDAIKAHDPSTPLYLYYAPHAVSGKACELVFFVDDHL